MLGTIRDRARRRVLTTSYPTMPETTPPLYRGTPLFDPAHCTGCADCADVCPSGAIEVERGAADAWSWRLDLARCVGCGACAEACPTGALAISRAFELAARSREDLLTHVSVRAERGTSAVAVDAGVGGRREGRDPSSRPLLGMTEAGEQLRRRIASLFRSSLHVRHLDLGSSNAEDWELTATLNPIYDLQRFGIDFVASPRHADMLVVTGAVTRNLAPALWHTYEATPDPKLVVALGTDACSGGVWGASYATAGGVDRCVPVDVYIPGDPPRPQAIVHGLLLALDRREQKVRADSAIATSSESGRWAQPPRPGERAAVEPRP